MWILLYFMQQKVNITNYKSVANVAKMLQNKKIRTIETIIKKISAWLKK